MKLPIAREGLPFVVPLAIVSGVVAFWEPWASLLPLALLGFTLWFFRDPERQPPRDSAAVLSPADGRVIRASDLEVSVFMNLLNVHVCRSPVAGRVVSQAHSPGLFLAAFRDDAPETNERVALVLEGGFGNLRLTLVAGLVARRIVSRVREGQQLAAGERVGLIRFGSRVDVKLPPGTSLQVEVGDAVRGGKTVIARLPAGGAERGSPRSFPV